MIRVLLVDDQPCARLGLRMWLGLESDLTVVGEAANGAEALRLARELRPDVILMDVSMPNVDGIAATAALHPSTGRSAVVVLSLRDDVETRARALAAGAFAFVGKHESVDALLAAIRQAAWAPEQPQATG